MKRLDNYLRITFGLSALVWGTSGRAGRWGSPLLTIAGAMKVAEGVTGYRPMLQAITAIAIRRKPSQSKVADPSEEAANRERSGDGSDESLWRPTAPDPGHESSRFTMRSRHSDYRSEG